MDFYKDSYNSGLLYDFGIQKGDICHIGTFSNSPGPFDRYIICTQEGLQINSGTWETMKLESYSDPECTGFLEMPGTWIKGLGGKRGVAENNFAFAEGSVKDLVQASINGNVIFQKEDSFFNTPADNSIINVEGLVLEITNKRRLVPVRIRTADGMLIYDKIVKHAVVHLPGPGEYIIKIGTLEPLSVIAEQ